jgi:hypothetical protein
VMGEFQYIAEQLKQSLESVQTQADS